MKKLFVVFACLALAVSASAQGRGRGPAPIPVRPQQQSFDTSKGPLKITPLYGASALVEIPGVTIYIDPAKPALQDGLPDAGYILITDVAPGHMDANGVERFGQAEGRGTRVVGPKAVLDDTKVARQVLNVTAGGRPMANGDTVVLDARNGWSIDAVPLYNIKPNTLPARPKGRGNGYILTFGDKRIYFSGDSQATPEMRALQNIEVAFISLNPTAMTPQEAADAVKAFHPKVVYPYNYQGSDPQVFAKALEGVRHRRCACSIGTPSRRSRCLSRRSKMRFLLVVLACAALNVSVFAQGRPTASIPVRPQQQSFDTSIGPVKITPLYHASVLIEMANTAIYIDPAKPVPLDGLVDATAILITDVHPDHMDANAIYTLGKATPKGRE